VDVDNLLISQPSTGEEALEVIDALIRSNAISIVVLDSVAALVPKAEIEGEMGDSHVGLQARLMSQALRKITGSLSKTGTAAIFINQLREKIGVMFGNPETQPGGPRAEVLLVGAPGCPPHRDAQERQRHGRHPDARQGRKKQGRAALQAGGVRHHVRAGDLALGLDHRHRDRAGDDQQGRRVLFL
jgi:hypothetical protein